MNNKTTFTNKNEPIFTVTPRFQISNSKTSAITVWNKHLITSYFSILTIHCFTSFHRGQMWNKQVSDTTGEFPVLFTQTSRKNNKLVAGKRKQSCKHVLTIPLRAMQKHCYCTLRTTGSSLTSAQTCKLSCISSHFYKKNELEDLYTST